MNYSFARVALLVLALSLAAAFGPATAVAAEIPGAFAPESTQVDLPKPSDFSALVVKFTCVPAEVYEEDVALQRCVGSLDLRISTIKDQSYWSTKGWSQLASMPIDVPVGPNTIRIPTPDLEQRMLAAKVDANGVAEGRIYASYAPAIGEVQTLIGETAHAERGRRGTMDIRRTAMSGLSCGMPASIAVKTSLAPLRRVSWGVSRVNGNESYFVDTIETNTTKINHQHWYVARAPMTIKLNGLTYTIAKGSQFGFQCARWGNGGVTARKLSPTVYLEHGKITIAGKPTGRNQSGAGVRARPGFFGSLSPSTRVNFSVETGGRKGTVNFFARMRSMAGSVAAFPMWKNDPSAHCSAGQSVRIRMDGRTTRG